MPKRPAKSEPTTETEAQVLAGRRIKAIRELGEVTQQQICELLGVDQSTWSKWEAGKRMPDLHKMRKFADRFQISLDLIFRGIPGNSHPGLIQLLRRRHSDLLSPPPTDMIPDTDTAQALYKAAISRTSAA